MSENRPGAPSLKERLGFSGMDSYAKQITAYLGPWGFQTARLDFDGLIDLAKMVFDVPGRSLREVAYAIKGLGKVERSARAREAVRRRFSEPSVLLPVNAPIRKMLAKETIS